MHDKIVLANKVPVEADDIIDYIIDGITDLSLQDQGRIQGFTTTVSLLKAFEGIILRPRGQRDNIAATKPNGIAKQQKSDGEERNRPKRYYNCGEQNHLSADCPTREKDMKCFRCGECGHIAAKCTEKKKNDCALRREIL